MTKLCRWWFALYRLIGIAFLIFKLRQQTPYGKVNAAPHQKKLIIKQQRKPAWVKNEIIRLKAFYLHGCNVCRFCRSKHLLWFTRAAEKLPIPLTGFMKINGR
jgi:hypothetical protein